MRPLFYQDSRESLGTSSHGTSVFSHCHLVYNDYYRHSLRVIDEKPTGMAKRNAPRVAKKRQCVRNFVTNIFYKRKQYISGVVVQLLF